MAKKPKTKFFPAPEAQRIGQSLIQNHHTHLADVRVEFVFLADTPASNGKETWGRARKIGGLQSFLSRSSKGEQPSDFFVIELALPIWERLLEHQQVALVDHELMHCGAEDMENEEGDEWKRLYLIPHDFEGFRAEIERYGLWRPDAALLAETMKDAQMSFTFNRTELEEEDDDRKLESSLGDVTVTFTPAMMPAVEEMGKKLRKSPRAKKDKPIKVHSFDGTTEEI